MDLDLNEIERLLSDEEHKWYISPPVVAQLVAEVRALREDAADWKRRWQDAVDQASKLTIERNDALLGAERAREERNRIGVEIRREWMTKCETLREDAERYRRLKSFAHPSYNITGISNADSASLAKKEFITVHAGSWAAMDSVLDGVVTVNTVNIKEPQ